MTHLTSLPPRTGFSWARLWQMIRKEMKQMWRDPKARPLILVSPVVQMFLLGYAATSDVNHISTIVADHDRTAASRALVQAYEATGYFQVVATTDRAEVITRALDEGRATVGLTIPAGYARQRDGGNGAVVQVVVDGADASLATVAQSYAARVAAEHGARVAGARHAGGIDLRARAWYNPGLESRYFNVPAIMGVQIFMVCLMMTAMGVVREREIGTLDQLLVSPVAPVEIIVGKTIPVLGLGMVHLVIYTLLTVVHFGVPLEGSMLVLGTAAALYILVGLAIGLLISTASRTQQEAFMLLILIFLPCVMLSGFVSPVESMPPLFQWFTVINPIRYFMEIVRGVFLKGSGLAVLWPQFVIIAGMSLLLFGVATRRFRRLVT